MITIKRAYDPPDDRDGVRVLVDRLWPRGVTKAAARIDHWMKDLAPSADLRKWFAHDPAKWPEFRRRYHKELAAQPDALAELRKLARGATVTLVYGARDQQHNDAVALKELLDRKPKTARKPKAARPASARRPATRRHAR